MRNVWRSMIEQRVIGVGYIHWHAACVQDSKRVCTAAAAAAAGSRHFEHTL